MRWGSSANTSRQSPISVQVRRRQTIWTEEARTAEFWARSLVPISVSIGHEPVIVQPASTIACSWASQPAVDL